MDALLQKFRACEESENRLRVDLDAACVSEANQTALAAKLHALFSEEQEPPRRPMNNESNFPPNFEKLVLGCIDADFCK